MSRSYNAIACLRPVYHRYCATAFLHLVYRDYSATTIPQPVYQSNIATAFLHLLYHVTASLHIQRRSYHATASPHIQPHGHCMIVCHHLPHCSIVIIRSSVSVRDVILSFPLICWAICLESPLSVLSTEAFVRQSLGVLYAVGILWPLLSLSLRPAPHPTPPIGSSYWMASCFHQQCYYQSATSSLCP